MHSLSKLLERIKKSLDSGSEQKEIIQKIIESQTFIKIDTKELLIKGDTLWVTTSPTKRVEIKMNEERLLDLLGRELGLALKRISYK